MNLMTYYLEKGREKIVNRKKRKIEITTNSELTKIIINIKKKLCEKSK